MKVFLCFATLILAAGAVPYKEILLKEWQLYKAEFNKTYNTPAEDYYRMGIFRDNKYDVASHNLRYRSGEETFEMEINQFSDMLPEEVDEIYNGFNKENRLLAKEGEEPILPELEGEDFVAPPNLRAPSAVDWVQFGAVTAVKSQGKCGSCYSFAAIGALEGHQYIKTKKLVDLSMQNVVDCSNAYGNRGCNGGLASFSFNYIKDNRGVNGYDAYPYEAKVGRCRFNPDKVEGKCSGYYQIPSGNEEELKNAVALGPVAVSIDASLKTFHMYKGGVYSDPSCSSTKLGHAVLIVGYGTDAATNRDFWLVKNSWGPEWGDKGYVKMARNRRNMCGVATRAVFPKV